ncbi:Mucin-5B [Mactra antiquata]
MNKIILTVLVVLAVAAVSQAKKCIHNGIAYNPGDSYQDNCNTCKCMESGNGACTRKGCPPKVCRHNGARYAAGERFRDACNTCRCTETGVAACTQKACI